jgi:hypothetical protein
MSDIVARFAAGDSGFGHAGSEVAYGEAQALQKLADVQYDSIMKTLDAFRAEMRSEFAALRANNQAEVFRQLLPLSERVAPLGSRLK